MFLKLFTINPWVTFPSAAQATCWYNDISWSPWIPASIPIPYSNSHEFTINPPLCPIPIGSPLGKSSHRPGHLLMRRSEFPLGANWMRCTASPARWSKSRKFLPRAKLSGDAVVTWKVLKTLEKTGENEVQPSKTGGSNSNRFSQKGNLSINKYQTGEFVIRNGDRTAYTLK